MRWPGVAGTIQLELAFAWGWISDIATLFLAALKRRKAAHSKGFARFVASNAAKRLECGAFHRFLLFNLNLKNDPHGSVNPGGRAY
jgi:hypothetical protein